ncbi:MAG: hypothetical protein ACOYOV_09095 [Bacteroidales bacterium]
MKKIMFFIVFLACAFLSANAQCDDNTKSVLNVKIDEAFTDWGKNWWVDSYISRSTRIETCNLGNYADELAVTGRFDYRRAGATNNIPFTAKIRVYKDGTITLTELCYDDTKYQGGVNCR